MKVGAKVKRGIGTCEVLRVDISSAEAGWSNHVSTIVISSTTATACYTSYSSPIPLVVLTCQSEQRAEWLVQAQQRSDFLCLGRRREEEEEKKNRRRRRREEVEKKKRRGEGEGGEKRRRRRR